MCTYTPTHPHIPGLTHLFLQASVITVSEPHPSLVIQQHIAEILRADEELATKFLDTVLKQLNWAFSEFIGMLQEVSMYTGTILNYLTLSEEMLLCLFCSF